MKIVIEISKEDYKLIKSYGKGSTNYRISLNLYDAVKNGIPLPKGHGRLIDADNIALIDEQFYVPSDYYVAESAINDAPTIIEAEGSDSK